MSLWSSSDVSDASVTLPAPEVQPGQTLFSSSAGYSVLAFIGEGCFGKVAKCQNLTTKETVAVKVLKKDTDFIQDAEKEVCILNVISVLNPDHTNVVKFFEQFEHMGQTCLVFEMLDRSLYDLLQERDWEPLSLDKIRPILKQLLVALDALKGLSILHTDIKPDNIMFVNKQVQPLRVKLIDFGKAIPASKVQPGLALQPVGYRAPEIALGFPFTEAIDVWGVGCVLAFLYLAENLFPVDCDYQMMKRMVEVLGQPDDHLLRKGKYTQYFFSEEEAAGGPTWRVMTPEEYSAANNVKPGERNSFIELPGSLDGLVNIYPKGETAEFEDRRAFVDIMKGLLHLDGDQRISPCQALQHSFITMTHLTEQLDYLTTSLTMMSNCPVEASADRINSSAASATGSFNGNEATVAYDDGPNTGSPDGVSVTFSYDDPASWSSEGGLLSTSYDEDQASWSSDGGLLSTPHDEDPASWSSDGGLFCSSYDKDPASWSSDGGLLSAPHDEDPASWSSDGGLFSSSYDKDPASWSSDGGLLSSSYDKDPDSWSSDGGLLSAPYDEDPASWSSDGGLLSTSYDKDPASWSSDGTEAKDTYEDTPASGTSDGGLLSTSYYEDPASWSLDGGLLSTPYDEDPASWSSDGGLLSTSYDKDPASWSSDGTEAKDSYEDSPAPWTSDGGLLSTSYDKDPASLSSDRTEAKDSYEDSPAPWTSDGGLLSTPYDEDPASWSFN